MRKVARYDRRSMRVAGAPTNQKQLRWGEFRKRHKNKLKESLPLAKFAILMMSVFARRRSTSGAYIFVSSEVGAARPLPYDSPTLMAANSPRRCLRMSVGKSAAAPSCLMAS